MSDKLLPEITQQQHCRYCRAEGPVKYCASCGQAYTSKKLTIGGMLHEAFHYFTHLDKGFPHTLKQLAISPGKMQRDYIEGARSQHQKPFSMFFLSGTIAALTMYYVNLVLINYFNAGDNAEGAFFQKYWVLLQVAMLPFYAFVTYGFFKTKNLNYAEIMVQQLYLFSFLFFVVAFVHLLKFIWPDLETRYIELPVIAFYSIWTNLNFFNSDQKWIVIGKSVLSIGICFAAAAMIQDFLIH